MERSGVARLRPRLIVSLQGIGEFLSGIFGPNTLPLVLSWPILGLVVALLLFVLYMTFVPGLPTEPGLTFYHWTDVATPYMVEKVIPNTVIVGVGTTLVTVFFGCTLAWLLTRTSLPFRNFFMSSIAVVVIVPGFVKAMGWIILVNERIGLINKSIAGLLGLESVPLALNNPYGMAWVMGLALTPVMVFLIAGPMRALDPVLEEAASVSGVNRYWTIIRISMPLMWPGIAGGAIYTFMTAISIFEVPAILAGQGGHAPVLATELFYTIRPLTETSPEIAYGAAGVYGVLIAAPSLVALYFYHRLLAKGYRYSVITGKGYRPRETDLGPLKYLGVGFVLLYLTLAVILPLLTLVWISLLPLIQMPSVEALSKLSLRNYYNFYPTMGAPHMIRNTIALLAGVTLLVPIFSFMTSWIVVRTRLKVRYAMDTIAMLPHAIPGLAFAFALFMVALLIARWFPDFPFSGTVGIIVIVNVLNRMAYATRITNAALVQVHNELEECARVCGATNFAIIKKVIWPLIKSSLVFSALWTALLTFREVSMAMFLTETKNTVLSVAIWRLWQIGHMGEAAAAVMVMVGISALLLTVIMVATGGRSGDRQQASLFNTGG